MLTPETVKNSLDFAAFYQTELGELNPGANGNHLGLCPFHDDNNPSLSVNLQTGLYHCFGCQAEGDVFTFYQKKHKVGFTEALKELARIAGVNAPKPQAPKSRIVATYDYVDPKGELIFQVCRKEPGKGGKKKDFPQRRPDGNGGWIWNLEGVTPVPYRLPELLKSDTVFVVEGEKDVHSLEAMGVTATCNSGGAGKWRAEYNSHFQEKAAVIIPDNDPQGKAHAQDVARNLHGIAASVKFVELPGLPEKGDVSDWIKAGGTKAQLLTLVGAAPEYDPATAPAPAPAPGEPEKKPTQAAMLLELAAEAELFHDLNRKGYATIPVKGHLETWPIKSMAFRDWLLGLFYKTHGKPPGSQGLQDALDLLAAQARFDGQEHAVFVRLAHSGGKIYVDLANDEWQAVEISSQEWRVIDRPPVKFRRPRGLAPLPLPELGGTLDDLKPFINCREEDWPLIVAWLLGAFSPGPYPVLIFQGEQGTAKTTTAKALKSLVDPGHTPQRTAPREIRDLMIFASNSWCLSFDNLSVLKDWLSDGFCRLATGGGLSKRELYSDSDETILDAMRPVILNGIDSLVSRADLADRAILLELPRIDDSYRQREADFWREFEAAQPGILGAIFDCLSAALANVHTVKLAKLPRMADFATWVVAADPALPWNPGTFLAAYTQNRAAVVEHSLEGDSVAVALRSFMEDRESWEGGPTDLLHALIETVGELVSRSKAWPKAANGLSNRLRRASTFLRASGLEVEWFKTSGGKRLVAIRKGMQKTATTATTAQSQEICGFSSGDHSGDGGDSGDPTATTAQRPPQRKATNDKGLGDSGDSGDKKPPFSKADENLTLFNNRYGGEI